MEGSPEDTETPLWNELAFRARIHAIIRSQGRKPAEVLETAGLGHTYLDRAPNIGGRSITSLVRLARALNITICELLEGAVGCPIRPKNPTLCSKSDGLRPPPQ